MEVEVRKCSDRHGTSGQWANANTTWAVRLKLYPVIVIGWLERHPPVLGNASMGHPETEVTVIGRTGKLNDMELRYVK